MLVSFEAIPLWVSRSRVTLAISDPAPASDPGATSAGVPMPVARFESVTFPVASSARQASRRTSVATSAPSSRKPVIGPAVRSLVLKVRVRIWPLIDRRPSPRRPTA